MRKVGSHLADLAIIGMTLLAAAALGTAIAVLPPGATVRLFAGLFAAAMLLLFWGLRAESNDARFVWHLWISALMVILSVVWPRYAFLHISGLPSINPLTIGAAAYSFIVLSAFLAAPKFSRQVGQTIVYHGILPKLIVLAFAWRLLSCVLGEVPIASIGGLLKEMIYINSFVLFGYVLASVPNGGVILFRVLIASGIFVGAAGVIEAFTQHNAFVRFATVGADGDMAGVLAGITSEKIRAGGFRAQSTFDHPIVFAQFVAALTPIAIYGAIHEKKALWRTLSILALPLLFLAIAKSGSRSGIVSAVVGLGFFALIVWLRSMLHGRTARVVALFSLPVLLAGVGIGFLVIQELSAGRGQHEVSSSKVRLQMLTDGINALAESPIFGFGHGAAIFKAGVMNANRQATIDNYFLSLALDSGYVGLALFLALLAVFTFKAMRTAVMEPGPDGMYVAACIASVLAIAATFAGLSIINNMTLLWLLTSATAPYMRRAAAAARLGKVAT